MADASFAELLRTSPARLREGDRWWSMAELATAAHDQLAPENGPVLLTRDSVAGLVQHLLAVDGKVPDLVFRPAEMTEDACRLLMAGLPAVSGTDATRWHLATSGTTARPRLIPHTLASLRRSLRPAPVPPRRWGLVYDVARLAGLQVLLQALFAGEEVVVLPANADQAGMAAAQSVDALSATPSWWRRLALQGFPAGWMLRQITLGGEIADQGILDHLRTAFPAARIHHIYASTEAGAGFAVGDGQAGFPASYLDDGVAALSLRIADDGHLWLRPPQQEWLDSGDVVALRGDRVYFLGRASGVINVGGNKVHPEAVEAVLCAHESVAAARVSAKTNPVLGQVVHAEVLLRAAADVPWRDLLRQHCHMNLAPHEVPAIIALMKNVELGPTGKVVRHG
jgi:acyl-CoA synthetase (AMP-forming)/AMP-acid ligase II